MEPKNPGIYLELSMLNSQLKNYNKARKLLLEAISITPTNINYKMKLANLYVREKKVPDAISIYEKLIKDKVKQKEVYINLGALYQMSKNAKGAIKMFTKAIQIDPNDPVSHYNLASVYAFSGWWDEAAWEYRRTLELKADFIDVKFYLAKVFFNKAWYKEAKELWGEFIKEGKDKAKIREARSGITEASDWMKKLESSTGR